MLKKNKGLLILTSVMFLLPAVIGVLLWNRLPEIVPTHWGMDGNADGWSSRAFAVFGLPLILLAVHWLCLWITERDNRKRGQSAKIMRLMIWLVPVISIFGSCSIYAAALGYPMDNTRVPLLFLGLILSIVGNYLPKTIQNRTIGIKIKWTLEDEANWNATHRLAGKLWTVGGLLLIVAAFLPGELYIYAAPLLLGMMVVIPVGYSWWFHRRQKGEE